MFDRVLVANRGEIACRILRTCRRLGIATVAVHSSADAGSRHVAEADAAVAIGGASASDSYLRADRIVEAALASGAGAVHPGYGFLSEKTELIDACEAAGLVFVGPHRGAVEAMGSKIESKRIARAAGVACVPGYDGDAQGPQQLLEEARRIGFPLLIKASAGGGGKGMRRVDAAEDFAAALGLARREAMAAFGDDRVLLERCIVRPRHVEVQLMGDRHGGLVHLFERECSIQRRFQKVVEEAPANHLPPAVAERLYASALALGRAIAYDNAGTVEFVLDADDGDTPYFLEVNTRLQVEHPVTEATTGIDLVEWQLRSAAGEPLPLAQPAIRRRGWAVECRVNAEEPEHGHRASLGTVTGYAEPAGIAGVRVDSGLRAGSEVTPHYDSLLAKVVGSGPTREQAVRQAQAGLQRLRIEGLRTNAALLLQVLRHPAFGDVLTTDFLERHFPDGPRPDDGERQCHRLAVAAAWAAGQALPLPVWGSLRGFRVTAAAGRAARTELRLRDAAAGGDAETVTLSLDGGVHADTAAPGWRATVAPVAEDGAGGPAPGTGGGRRVQVTPAGGASAVEVRVRPAGGGRWFTWSQGSSHVWEIVHGLSWRASAAGGDDVASALSATLPGRVAEVAVRAGDRVDAGAPLVTLEAMKLYHALASPRAGVVRRVHAAVGDTVAHGQLLVEFEPAAAAAAVAEGGERDAAGAAVPPARGDSPHPI